MSNNQNRRTKEQQLAPHFKTGRVRELAYGLFVLDAKYAHVETLFTSGAVKPEQLRRTSEVITKLRDGIRDVVHEIQLLTASTQRQHGLDYSFDMSEEQISYALTKERFVKMVGDKGIEKLGDERVRGFIRLAASGRLPITVVSQFARNEVFIDSKVEEAVESGALTLEQIEKCSKNQLKKMRIKASSMVKMKTPLEDVAKAFIQWIADGAMPQEAKEKADMVKEPVVEAANTESNEPVKKAKAEPKKARATRKKVVKPDDVEKVVAGDVAEVDASQL